jgi:hypothetical protein
MTTPLETNARKLVQVLLQYFPAGGTSDDLRKQFEKETSLHSPQSYYAALSHGKKQGWFTGGGRGQPYKLSSDGSWKEPDIASIGASLRAGRDRDQLEYLIDTQTQQIGKLQDKVERLLDWSNGGDAGVALPSLVKIVGDDTASTRQRLKAAAAVLAYKVQDDAVIEFVKKFLGSVCASPDIGNIDYKIEAGELLRRHEAPKVSPETVRPNYRENEDRPAEPSEPLRDLVARRRARMYAMWKAAPELYDGTATLSDDFLCTDRQWC